MPTVCIQCAMKAIVAGETPPSFDETPEEHMKRYHPDPAATQRERMRLEMKIAELIDKGPKETP